MMIEERKYEKPQFEVVVINSVDIITSSDNELDWGDVKNT
jgi:hypothetical protein